MQTALEYLMMAQHCERIAGQTADRDRRRLLRSLAESYKVLAESTQVLERSRKVQDRTTNSRLKPAGKF